jgi:hypothetical protein
MADEKEPVDPTNYLDKPPTALQERFAVWIKEEVGYNPAAAKTKEEAFQNGVRIATATRMVFQASDFNRAANEEARLQREAERAEAEAEAEEAPAPVKKPMPVKPAKATRAKAAAKATTPGPEPEPEEPVVTPAKPTRRPARRAAAAAPASGEAPF